MNRFFGYYLILGLLCFSLTGCATYTSLTLDYDQNADFAGYKTYAWAPPGSLGPNLSMSQNDLIEARVKEYVDQVMAEKGFQEAPAYGADFLITYHNIYKEKQSIRNVGSYGYGPGLYLQTYSHRGRRGRHGQHSGWVQPYYYQPRQVVEYYTEGTFVLDVIDRNTQKLVWRGTATRVLFDTSPEALDQKMKEAAFELLQKFPPPPPPQAPESAALPAVVPAHIPSPRPDEPFVVHAVKQ